MVHVTTTVDGLTRQLQALLRRNRGKDAAPAGGSGWLSNSDASGSPGTKCFFTNSGEPAVELAVSSKIGNGGVGPGGQGDELDRLY